MSNQSMSDELVERLFSRFSQIYGAQKFASMWGTVDHAELKEIWGASLGRFPLPVVGKAVKALIESPGEWPPTLPEFVTLCKQYNRPEHNPAALPAPGDGFTDAETAQANLERIREMLAGIGKAKA